MTGLLCGALLIVAIVAVALPVQVRVEHGVLSCEGPAAAIAVHGPQGATFTTDLDNPPPERPFDVRLAPCQRRAWVQVGLGLVAAVGGTVLGWSWLRARRRMNPAR